MSKELWHTTIVYERSRHRKQGGIKALGPDQGTWRKHEGMERTCKSSMQEYGVCQRGTVGNEIGKEIHG